MDIWTNICLRLYLYILRPMFKWFLHVMSGHSELERIIGGKTRGYSRVSAVESSLLRSRRAELRGLPHCPVAVVPSAVQTVLKNKYVSIKDAKWFVPGITASLSLILSHNELVREVERLRLVPYDRQNPRHEELLMELWNELQPTVSLKFRISKQWQNCGFQGDDPATDFRGMGKLGLQQLVFFAKNHKPEALRMLCKSNHPTMGYPFAITGISMTSMCRDLLRKGLLKSHFYNQRSNATLEDFHQVYSYIFNRFDQMWFDAKPENIMAFGSVRDQLYQQLTDELSAGNSLFDSAAQH